VVTTRGLSPSATLDVLLQTSSRQRKKGSGPRLLKSGASIDVHHGTARIAAKAILWSDSLKPGEQTIAELRLNSPIFAFLGDRFVIRDRSQQYTLAGGIVLDPDAERARFRTKAQRTFLRARAEAGNDLEAYVSSEIQRAGAVPVSKLLLKSLFRAEEIRAAVERLQRNGDAVMRENIAADPAAWRSWQARAAALIDEGHAKNPQHAGLDLSSLRAAIPDHTPDVFEALLSDLCADGFCRRGQIIARVTHQPALPVPLEAVAKLILQALADKPFDPPTPKQLAPEKRSHQALKFLIENGTVAEISSDLVLLRASLEQMQSTIENFIKSHGPATVSELRQELQTSRRIMVPLLEYLDRRGVTSRAGDRRTLAH
jgi:selenocysteine-specific elongation factor